jgi:hypothetical protein
MMLATLAGCAEPTGVVRATPPSQIIIIGGHPVVLTAQLRAIGNPNEIGNPDEKPLSAVVGVLQLKLTASDETGLVVVSWQLHFANPECSSATVGGGGDVYIQDSEERPGEVVLRLIPPGDPLGCGDNFLEGSSSISDALAALMIQDPEDFVARFFLEDGDIIMGTLQLAGLELTPTR